MSIPTAPVTLILPTFNHASTLDLSIRSVLEQTYGDFTLVVIGDGVHDDTRDVMSSFVDRDARVYFLDREKSPRHAELVRDEVIKATASSLIGYHGDDDLLLPHHLEQMLEDLNGNDFVHPLPVLINADGVPAILPTDLSRPECLSWHVGPPPRNAVSLTGVVHTRDIYQRLPFGWRQTPQGHFTDQYMWEQFFSLPELRALTSRKATTIKLASSVRTTLSPSERSDEITQWWSRIHDDDFEVWWTEQIHEAIYQAAVDATLATANNTDVRIQVVETQRDAAVSALEALESSHVWRATAWYRHLRSGLSR
jgi:glycosyltransferase involved in cell wall biosynthesis